MLDTFRANSNYFDETTIICNMIYSNYFLKVGTLDSAYFNINKMKCVNYVNLKIVLSDLSNNAKFTIILKIPLAITTTFFPYISA